MKFSFKLANTSRSYGGVLRVHFLSGHDVLLVTGATYHHTAMDMLIHVILALLI